MRRVHLACLAAVAACALGWSGTRAAELSVNGAALAVPVHTLKALRFARTIRQQFDFSCGSAALATLLTYHYHHPVSEAAVFASMYAAGDQQQIRRAGFSLLDMQTYLATLGYRADGFALPLAALLRAGVPAIVLVTTNGYHHFVVIKGIGAGRVLVGDPALGTRTLSQDAFTAIWTSRLLFVIHGRTAAAQFNARADWNVAPLAPLGDALARTGLDRITLPKLGPGDF
jgi:predicted double-glycine peptidase